MFLKVMISPRQIVTFKSGYYNAHKIIILLDVINIFHFEFDKHIQICSFKNGGNTPWIEQFLFKFIECRPM